mgnify:CR=1 FL=1
MSVAIGILIVIIILVMGSVTPLVSILNPESGVIQNSKNLIYKNQTIKIPGLYDQVTIIQDKNGIYHIYASNDHDLFLALGYIQAKNRLFQMEIFALTGLGNLSGWLGSSFNSYDRFWTLAGGPITAEKDWQSVLSNSSINPVDAQTVLALEAYSQGINDYIAYAKANNLLPITFKLLGVQPFNWSPVDSFAVQEVMASSLEFGDDALLFSLLYSKLGNSVYQLIPTFSPVPQYYYAGYNGEPNQYVLEVSQNTYPVNQTVAGLAYEVAKMWDPPSWVVNAHVPENSNEWVVSGNRSATGKPILVGGPVLSFSLPAIWFQVQLVDPNYDVYGVVLPGAPAIIIGFNNRIAWTLTDTEAISWGTFFWVQQVKGDNYYWKGEWYPLKSYYVNGMRVNWTNLGPIMAQNGSTALVMTWMGNKVSNDLGVLLNIMNSSNWEQFREALESWYVPYQNFAFADNSTIADISAGYYPVFNSTNGLPYNPSAIMPGSGVEYISGSIPYSMIPQVVNPACGFIVSSNQRQVGPSYPYWYGNTMSFSAGFRAMMEFNYLNTHGNYSIKDMEDLQSENYTDYEAAMSVPYIIKYLSNSSNATVQEALSYLKNWDYDMSANSKAATIWFFTYELLFNETFIPYLYSHGFLPQYRDLFYPSGLGGSWPDTQGLPSLDEDMAYMIEKGSAFPFSNESMSNLLQEAIVKAMNYLQEEYPNGNFTWGHFYGFYFPSLLGISSISVGPLSRGGDYNTPNDAAGGGPESNWPSGGQSWIMVVNLKNISDSFGVYPGGQSEDPASPLYANYIGYWMNGTYLQLYYISSSKIFPASIIMDTIIMLPGDGS